MKRYYFIILLCGIGALFFLLSILSAPERKGDPMFDSPDETANYFWAQRVAKGEPLWYSEPLEVVGNSLLKPRSMNVIGTRVVPGSFLGLPLLYGYMAQWFGIWLIPYLTPLFASLAVIAFGLLMRRLFGASMGLLSAALLAFLPPWWYYASRGMYHNVLFVSLVIIGMSLLMCACFWIPSISVRDDNKARVFIRQAIRLIAYGIAGLCIGFSLVVRSSELVWVAFLTVFCFISGWRRVRVSGALLFIACGLFAFLPLFTTNIELYDAPISIGYRGVQGMELGEFITKLPDAQFRNLFFAPFGINFSQTVLAMQQFLVIYYWWWCALGAAGILLMVIRFFSTSRDEKMKWAGYSASAAAVTILLVIYYGSWAFSDRIDRNTISLNTSFFRYWLPIYMLGIPFVAYAILALSRLLRRSRMRNAAACMAVCMLAFFSARLALLDTDESLMSVRMRLSAAHFELQAAKSHMQPQAVIIIFPQADKILFPAYRRLITAMVTPDDFRAARRLAELLPVYYYTYAPPEYIGQIITPLFKKYNLQIVNGKKVYANHWVWQILPLTEALVRF